jgi:hypothetical protein
MVCVPAWSKNLCEGNAEKFAGKFSNFLKELRRGWLTKLFAVARLVFYLFNMMIITLPKQSTNCAINYFCGP